MILLSDILPIWDEKFSASCLFGLVSRVNCDDIVLRHPYLCLQHVESCQRELMKTSLLNSQQSDGFAGRGVRRCLELQLAKIERGITNDS